MIEKYDLMNDDPVIRTYTGKWVNVFDPNPETFDIKDIAHALSHQCRFSGHLAQLYNVANHSIFCYKEAVKQNLDKKEQLTALMHDCSEAYLVDIPRPIKREFAQYKVIESGLMCALSKVFGFNWPLSKEVIDIDNLALRGYIGSSTKKEIEYAISTNKIVKYLENIKL